uniref:NEDD4 binding protein 2-like 2 n=1 Tax=Echeneis naucrates TaxID=173247 RepID=A0A665VJ18_ECHNA
MQMSHTESSCATPPDTQSPCVGEPTHERPDTNIRCASPDSSVRDRVLKEVGFTSNTFIGPAFPPEMASQKSDIEDTLSEFYKELEKVDTPDGARENPGKQGAGLCHPPSPPETSANEQGRDTCKEEMANAAKSEEMDNSHKSSGQKEPSWPHWYHNKPYYTRRLRPPMDPSSTRAVPCHNQWHHPQPPIRWPNPRLHTRPLHHLPFPSEGPYPLNQSPRMAPSWSASGPANQYESGFPTFSRLSTQSTYSPDTQGSHEDYPHHLHRDEWGCSYNISSDSVGRGWSRDGEEQWSQFDADYDRHQSRVSENELWERQHHCRPPDNTHASSSSLVLILMRGLPGSGKSTLARYLLSTGPNGLVLSTDDYFAHNNGYRYDPDLLGVAHEWNQSRAKDAMHDCRSPIIIDNTNLQAWEMKPYVKMALERGYKVDFCEPNTSWKFDPYELEKRNKHGVQKEKIAHMLDRFSFPISIDIIMSSQEPPHVNLRRCPWPAQKMTRNRDFH